MLVAEYVYGIHYDAVCFVFLPDLLESALEIIRIGLMFSHDRFKEDIYDKDC